MMSNIAIIFAGGAGHRMNTKTMPKQFLELHGKPILIYTLEHFQKHEMIDGIVLVMLEEYIDYSRKLIKKYNIDKVVDIVRGGVNGQESIKNGLQRAYELFDEDSVVLIHDGVRPLIDDNTISKAIKCTNENGSAITVSPATETITVKNNANEKTNEIGDIISRHDCMLAKAPQCFILKDILSAHKKALEDGYFDIIDSATLMRTYGYKLYTIECSSENIKITTPIDFYMFRAIMEARENTQILGI